MAHNHPVYDSDPHFIIDPITRSITNASSKTVLMQYDHNSERFSFEISKFVEGHDLTLCNKVEIHYLNADNNRQDSNAGVYEVTDLVVDSENEDRVVFTWLVSQNATQFAGSLSFLIVFACVEGADVVYRWNTNINNSVSIAKGMNNGDSITEEYPDILAQWKDELAAVASGAGVIYAGPIEPDTYPYIWLDTSEYVGTSEKNVGYLTIKTGDGISQRLYPIVKMDSIEGLADAISNIQEAHTQDMQAVTDEFQNVRTEFANADNDLSDRIEDLETTLTGAVTAISHSLTEKGVTVPESMSIQDVAGLIDTITTDNETTLEGISFNAYPTKRVYNVGDTVDLSGIDMRADFGDGWVVRVHEEDESIVYTPKTINSAITDVYVGYTHDGTVAAMNTYPITVEGLTVGNLVVGTSIYVNDGIDYGMGEYRYVDSDYNGNALFVRMFTLDSQVQYMTTAPTSAEDFKYDGSALDAYLNTTYYNSLPAEVKTAIQSTNVPVRSNASNSATQEYLARNVFALSARELGLGGHTYEGTVIEDTSILTAVTGDSDYWTREPSMYMDGYGAFAFYVTDDSETGEKTVYGTVCTASQGVRPAFCLSKDQRIVFDQTQNCWMIPTSDQKTIADMELGDDVMIKESDRSTCVYTYVDSDYNGSGYALFVRGYVDSETDELVKYFSAEPDSAYASKYDGSALDIYLNTTFYDNMPTETQNVIRQVSIPVRQTASSSATQAYLERKVFALSTTELGLGGSSLDGEAIEYTNVARVGDDYWTRSLVSGMANYAYYVNASGTSASLAGTINKCARPAFCLSKSLMITYNETYGSWEIK